MHKLRISWLRWKLTELLLFPCLLSVPTFSSVEEGNTCLQQEKKDLAFKLKCPQLQKLMVQNFTQNEQLQNSTDTVRRGCFLKIYQKSNRIRFKMAQK